MVPQRCADKEYDAAIDRVNRVQEELEDYLEEQKRALGNYVFVFYEFKYQICICF